MVGAAGTMVGIMVTGIATARLVTKPMVNLATVSPDTAVSADMAASAGTVAAVATADDARPRGITSLVATR